MTAGVRVFLSQHSRCIDRKAKEALAALERHARKDYRRQIPINFALGLVDIRKRKIEEDTSGKSKTAIFHKWQPCSISICPPLFYAYRCKRPFS